MAKEVTSTINLYVTAGSANPAPPVGPALGQHGVNIMGFCKEFNERTKGQEAMPLPVVISVYKDKSFDFIIKTPPSSALIKKAAKLAKGAGLAGKETVGSISAEQIQEIAKMKLDDLNTVSLDEAVQTIRGTARSMGIEVKS